MIEKMKKTERTQAQKAVAPEFSGHRNSVFLPRETIAGSLRVSEDCTPIGQFHKKEFESDVFLLNCSYPDALADSIILSFVLLVGSAAACRMASC